MEELKERSFFVEFITCKDCGLIFKKCWGDKVVEHYYGRRRIKRCVGCEKMEKYNRERVKPFENRNKELERLQEIKKLEENESEVQEQEEKI